MNYIPIKTFRNYFCLKYIKDIILCDFTKMNNFIILTKSDNFKSVINKIKIDNKEFVIISKQNKSELYLIQNDNSNLKKVNNSFLNNILDLFIDKIIILDNENIAFWNEKLSYYIKKDLSYEKFFNNLNKHGPILELCKLSNNRFFSLTANMVIRLFNENFSSKEMDLKIEPANKNVNIKMFKISDDKIVIIGGSEFIIFDINLFETQLIFNTGPIYFATPFNEKGFNDDNDIYHNLALIIKEFDEFYLKIFTLSSHDILETEKIKPNFQRISNVKGQLKYLKCDINEALVLFESICDKSMYYDFNDKGNLILIINSDSAISINIDLNKLKYI